MSRPPSPITSPSSMIFNNNNNSINNHENTDNINNNNNNTFDDASFRDTSEKMNRLGQLAEHSQLNYTFGSLEDEGGVTRLDPGEMQHEMLELQHTNRRLTGENVELNAHLTHAEDVNVSLREQCQHLEQALNSVQQQLVAARRLEAEMVEVRSQLDSEHEEKERLLDRLAHLEKDNFSLTSRLEDLLQKLNSAQEELESQAALEAEMVKNHKTETATLVAELTKWRSQAEKQTVAAHDLEETIKDLQKFIEVLRDEKSSLEDQLAYVREELASLNSHPETDVSGVDMSEEMEPGNVVTGEVKVSKLLEKGTLRHSSFSPTFFTRSALSSEQDTPLSIHSELQTMGESRGSLPFCEKAEDSPLSVQQSNAEVKGILEQSSFSVIGDTLLATLLTNMLSWWRHWEENGTPLLKGLMESDASALRAHFAAHHDELLKFERELQDVRKKGMIQIPSPSTGRMLMSGSREGAQTISHESGLPSPRSTPPKQRHPRSAGSHVSQLISKFEFSSRSTSPAYSDHSERLASMDFKSNLSKTMEAARTGRGSLSSYLDNDADRSSPSYDNGRGSPWSDSSRTSPYSNRSIDSPRNYSQTDFKSVKESTVQERKSFEEEVCMVGVNADSATREISSKHLDSEMVCAKDFVNNESPTNQEQNSDVHSDVVTNSLPQKGSLTPRCDEFEKEKRFKDPVEDTEEGESILIELGLETEEFIVKDDNVEDMKEENNTRSPEDLVECRNESKNGISSTTVEVDLELETDIYMESSHLMKLMNEVAEQRTAIVDLRQQLNLAEEEKESFTIVLTRLHNLVLQISINTFRWTEGVRKEWLSVVPGTGEDEGAADPLRTPCPIDDAPLTGTHSREEIESLIRARCELGCPLSGNDFTTRDYVSPENLAAELERELLALKLHVARSHALLHHYQSSSLHGSRSEVSTPPGAGPHHVQGVEAGVECDLCGPTCLPRPCGSAATQTPASPAPATPECEESTAAATALWEADEGASVTEDLLQEDGDQQSLTPQHRALRQVGILPPPTPQHRPLRQVRLLPPQHRPLRQCLEVKEEEEEEEEVVVIGVEDTTDMASEHTLYAPKPAYDQLDQYRSTSRRKGDEKLRRTGLTTVSPQVDGSTDGEESECEEIRVRPIRRSRPLVHIHQTRVTDPEGAPLSPPPSLDNVDEEEEDPLTKEEVLLPSTPESGSSVTSADLFCHLTDGTTSGSNESGVRSLNPPSSPVAEVDRNVPAVPFCTSTRPGPLSSTPATSVTLSTPAVPTAPATPTTPASPTAPANPECVGAGRVERSKSCSAVFPSLHDPFLRTVGLSKDDPIPNENLSAQEIEGKFTQLSLAFKTDRLTLRQRLDVQQRQRDTAETNFETEINQLRSSILALHADCVDSELVDAITQVRRHLDILATSSIRLVSASEVWGAVQQEWRVSRALEVLLLHVENVKRMYERDHLELEELRRLLNEYQIELPVSTGTVSGTNQSPADSQAVSRRVRALSLAGCTNKQTQENRRISLSSGTAKTAANAFLASRGSRRRASLMPDLKPFKEHLAAVAAAAAAAASATSSVTASATSKEKIEENGQPSNGVWGSSITEEGSESGEEGNDCTLMTSSNATPNSSISRALAQLHPDLYAAEQTPQDSDRRLSEESNLSSVSQSIDADAATPSTPAPSPNPIPQHWLMVAVDDVMGWIRGGRWPYSPQETVQGARYAFTSLLLLLAAFFLLLTISYGDSNVPQPYHPGWTTIHHVLHPFVAVRYMGIPPT